MEEEKVMRLPDFTVPKSVLQSLLAFTNSSTLNETLDLLIQVSRTVEGRSDLASRSILPVILQLTLHLSDQLSTPHPLLLSSLKLLRNLCAGEIKNQNSFIEHNGVEVVSIALNAVRMMGYDSDFGVVRMGLQLLGNVSLAGDKHQSAVWDRFFPVELLDLAKIGRKEVCDPLSMVLYTCCSVNHERIRELSGPRGLPILEEILRAASTVGFVEDWLKLLLSKICFEESCFPQLFSELFSPGAGQKSRDIECSNAHFTSEQAFLLSILSECLNHKIEETTVSYDFAIYVLGIMKRVVGVVGSVSKFKSGLPTGYTAIDVLGYALTILRDVCALGSVRDANEDEDSRDIVDSLLSSGLLDLLLSLIHDLEPPTIIRKCVKQSENQGPTSSDSRKACPYKGFRRDIVAVIGNCLYRRKRAQDEVRQKNGILLLLQQCVTDEDNPFLREWGIWSVRNLLEGNVENQKEVAELEVRGSVDVPELVGLGLRVEVDQKTGRAKLVNVS